MLEGLDEIDWANLEHAYGSAEDVPGLIRELLSEDPKVRAAAMWELEGNIHHQSTVYEASPYAVPFLIELVANPQIEDRARILNLLGLLGAGCSYLDVHQKQMSEEEKQEIPNFDAELATELADVKRTNAAVTAGRRVYLDLLRDRRFPEVRIEAIYLIAQCDSYAEEIDDHLLKELEGEPDVQTAASIVLTFIALHPEEHKKKRGLPYGDDLFMQLLIMLAMMFEERETPLTSTESLTRCEKVVFQYICEWTWHPEVLSDSKNFGRVIDYLEKRGLLELAKKMAGRED